MILGETLTYDLSIRITNPAAIRQKYRHWHNSILHLFSDFVFYPVLAQIDKAKAKDVFNYKGKKSYLNYQNLYFFIDANLVFLNHFNVCE